MLKTDELVGLPEWGYVYFEAASHHNLVRAAHG